MNPSPRFKDALDVLARHNVELVIVGGVAAVLGGAPISTFDLDIVPSRTNENIAKLVVALGEIDARYRDFSGRVLRPEHEALMGPGHHLLMTSCGPLDVLGEVIGGERYEQLVIESVEQRLGEHRFHVLGLPALIRLKEALDRDKDRAVLEILRRTLEESRKR